MGADAVATRVLALLPEIETEMRKLHLWTDGPPPIAGRGLPLLGLSFEQWLQFHFMPSLRRYLLEGAEGRIPYVRVGLGALQNFEQGSVSDPLILACTELEDLLKELPAAAFARSWEP